MRIKCSVKISNDRPDLFVYGKRKRDISSDTILRQTIDCQRGENEK